MGALAESLPQSGWPTGTREDLAHRQRYVDAAVAGEYVLLAQLYDQPMNRPNELFTFKRHSCGDVVTLDAKEARRLYAAGSVDPYLAPTAGTAAAAAKARYEAALSQTGTGQV